MPSRHDPKYMMYLNDNSWVQHNYTWQKYDDLLYNISHKSLLINLYNQSDCMKLIMLNNVIQACWFCRHLTVNIAQYVFKLSSVLLINKIISQSKKIFIWQITFSCHFLPQRNTFYMNSENKPLLNLFAVWCTKAYWKCVFWC